MSILEALLGPRRETPPEPEAKAATGPGVAVIEQGVPRSAILGDSYEKRAAQAVGTWQSNLWVRACERAISTRLGSVEWELQDEDGNPITQESSEAQQAVAQADSEPAGSGSEQAAPADVEPADAEAAEAEGGSEPESTLIDVVVQQTRQFKGEVEAPVKLIMFSDFQ